MAEAAARRRAARAARRVRPRPARARTPGRHRPDRDVLPRGRRRWGCADRDSLYWAGRVDARREPRRHRDLRRGVRRVVPLARAVGTGADDRADHFRPRTGRRRRAAGRARGHGRQTAGSWRVAADDDEPEPGDESSIRIVASAVEVLRVEVVRGADRGGTPSRRGDDPTTSPSACPSSGRAGRVRRRRGRDVRHPSNAPPVAPDPGRAVRTLRTGRGVRGRDRSC